jgi:two-component system, OmpR family, response regulator protein BraR/BceR
LSEADEINTIGTLDNYVEENTLNVNVTRLRKKLESIGLNNFIKTKKGLGYIVE